VGDREDLDLVELDAVDQGEGVSLEKKPSDVARIRWPAEGGLAQAVNASV
jgi:hypothetical protein